MRKFVIETDSNFRMSSIMSFDKDAKGVEITPSSHPITNPNETSLWKIETTLLFSQILLIKGVIRSGSIA